MKFCSYWKMINFLPIKRQLYSFFPTVSIPEGGPISTPVTAEVLFHADSNVIVTVKKSGYGTPVTIPGRSLEKWKEW